MRDLSSQQTGAEHDGSVVITSPEEARALCGGLTDSVMQLVQLLDRETALLRRPKPDGIKALQAQKSALAAAIARDMKVLQSNARSVKLAAADELEAMKAQNLVLQRSLKSNSEALMALQAVSESILKTIANKVMERRAGPEVYGQSATVSRQRTAPAAAISVDRAL